jgi:hypothetical protein
MTTTNLLSAVLACVRLMEVAANDHSLFFLCLSIKKEQPTKDLECLMFSMDKLWPPDATDGSDMAPTKNDVWRCLGRSNDSMYLIKGVSDTFFEERGLISGETILHTL